MKRAKTRWGGGGWGRHSWISWWGCATQLSKSSPYFRPQKMSISTPVFRPSFQNPYPFSDANNVIITYISTPTRDSLAFEFAYHSFFLTHFELKRPLSSCTVVPSKTIPIFRPNLRKPSPIPFGTAHTYMASL